MSEALTGWGPTRAGPPHLRSPGVAVGLQNPLLAYRCIRSELAHLCVCMDARMLLINGVQQLAGEGATLWVSNSDLQGHAVLV